jgi:hypothetical protein
MNPKSDNLFHFTRNAEHVKGILLNGFMPRHCLEDIKWLGLKDWNFLAYPMVCFCDIPISRISEHTAFYGEYGIGLTKEWGLRNGLTPVAYATEGSAITKVADYLLGIRFDGEADKDERETVLNTHIYGLISLVKPIKGNMQVAGAIVEKDFYQENEWRFVPSTANIIFEKSFLELREKEDKEMEANKISFTPNDVKYIFVKNDHEIPSLVDFINTQMGNFPHNDLKVLTTRIISLATIQKDL